MFVKNSSIFESTSQISRNSIEMLSTTLNGLIITSIYKPSNELFCIKPVLTNKKKVFIGDFNSHSTTWGYKNTNNDGEAVEQWAEAQNLNLIHDAKLPKSFNSKRWKKGYNTDLVFVSSNIETLCNKLVLQPIPRTQHRPWVLRPMQQSCRKLFHFNVALITPKQTGKPSLKNLKVMLKTWNLHPSNMISSLN